MIAGDFSKCYFSCSPKHGPPKFLITWSTQINWYSAYFCEGCMDYWARPDWISDLKPNIQPILEVIVGSELHIAMDHAFACLAGAL